MIRTFTMTADGIAHDGAAKSSLEGKPVRVHGMLPNEVGVVEARMKHGIWLGMLKEITVSSPSRKLPEETHYLSCAPWQVMEYPLQAELKLRILTELFSYHHDAPKATFVIADTFFGHRTKIEFSFTDRDALGNPAPLSLAFHERGGGTRRLALPNGCALASDEMNAAALVIVSRLRDAGISARQLKTLVIRESKSTKKILALLYAKDAHVPHINVGDISGLSGFIAFYSTEKSPASVATKELWRWGSDMLRENICALDIQYSWDSFFQNNVPMFEKAVAGIAKSVVNMHKPRILELYSGVGTVGLLLAKNAASVHGIEVVPRAVECANENSKLNGITNYRALCLSTEQMNASVLDDVDMLVLDPPRAGLSPNIIQIILEKLPTTIAYLSCNPVTQARDVALLAEHYRIDMLTGFDFYPQTPHLESLLVLSRKN